MGILDFLKRDKLTDALKKISRDVLHHDILVKPKQRVLFAMSFSIHEPVGCMISYWHKL